MPPRHSQGVTADDRRQAELDSILHGRAASPSPSPDPEQTGLEGSGEPPPSQGDWPTYGRMLCRLAGDPFTPLITIVEEGLLAEAEAEDEDVNANVESSEKYSRAYCSGDMRETFKLICELLGPKFKEDMLKFAGDRQRRKKICDQIHRIWKHGRAEDSGKLKFKLLEVVKRSSSVPVDSPLPDMKSKAGRGWNHPTLATLNCPIDWEPTAEVLEELRTGIRQAENKYWNRFMYPGDHIFNAEDESDQILYGDLVLRAMKIVCLGYHAAFAEPHPPSEGCIIRIIKAVEITLRLIAYIVIQVRFTLSSVEQWAQFDEKYDLRKLYWNVVSLFEDGWGQDVIEYFNLHIFGNKHGATYATQLTDPRTRIFDDTDENPTARQRRQRAAKRARLSA